MSKMLDRLRTAPPRSIGGLAVTGFQDLRSEDNWMGPIKGATDAAARNFLLFQLGDGAFEDGIGQFARRQSQAFGEG